MLLVMEGRLDGNSGRYSDMGIFISIWYQS